MATQSVCKIEGCDKIAAQGRKGMCLAHYKRGHRYGDPLTRLKITNGEAQRFYREVVLQYEGDECLPWPYAKYASRYGHIAYEGKDVTVSRLVCEHIHGAPPTPKHEAAHSCGKGHEACVTKRHVSWKTPIENAADKIAHNTVGRGERHPTSKLTESDVAEIRALRGKMLQRDIAAKFGVTRGAIGFIQRGERWGWL